MIYLFEAGQSDKDRRLPWAKLAAQGQCTLVSMSAATPLIDQIRSVADGDAATSVVLDERDIEAPGVPSWLRQLPAVCATYLVLHERPRAQPEVIQAWCSAVDGVLATSARHGLDTDATVVVPTNASELCSALAPEPLRRPCVRQVAQCVLPTKRGEFDVRVYSVDGAEDALLVSMGDLGLAPTFVRVHSECFTGEVLASLKCDCDGQLELAMTEVARRGRGAIVYLRQEGRGIGLGNKIRAYAEQAKGANTVEANHILGFPTDLRDFAAAAVILRDSGVQEIELQTNNPRKTSALRAHGIRIRAVLSTALDPNPHNLDYLRVKCETLGHLGLRDVLPPRRVRRGWQPDSTLVIFDLDGVVQFGQRIPEDAVALVNQLRARGYTLRFLTNDAYNSRMTRCMELRQSGIRVDLAEMYTASSLVARYAAGNGTVLPLMSGPGLDEFASLPLARATADTVVVGDWFDDYERALLQDAFTAVRNGAELVAVHRKPSWNRDGEQRIDVGFWVAGIEHATGCKATVIGKPAAYAYTAVLADSGFDAANAIMISDEVVPDLEGATQSGLYPMLFDPSGVGEFPGLVAADYDAVLRLLDDATEERCASS